MLRERARIFSYHGKGNMEPAEGITITKKKLRKILSDPEQSAEAVNLRYVSDSEPGIERIKKGKGFSYRLDQKKLKDKKTLARIRSLVIPPAWKNVWICRHENGHLQATGWDQKGRKQYRYHSLWNKFRNETKFLNLYQFGACLPSIRKRILEDLSLCGLNQQKVLATVVSLMQTTCIRIGNAIYEKLNGSFGLTTLKDKHVSIKGQKILFSFKGKKGIFHNISLKNKKLAKIVQACRDIPGKELFQYYDETGERKSIDSGMVNDYIKQISGGNFTAKDFRTWSGTLSALNAFKETGGFETQKEAKQNVVQALDKVAAQLGNTRTVCKKYYVHPVIIDLYQEKRLEKYFDNMENHPCLAEETGLSEEEKILLKILSEKTSAVIPSLSREK